jgi:hypothetical protein
VWDGNELRVVRLRDGERSPPLMQGEPAGIAWSPDGGQLAISAYAYVGIIDTATWQATNLPVRGDNTLTGPVQMAWLDDHTFVFSGRTDLDGGSNLWSATFRHGQLDGPITLALRVPRATAYELAAPAGGHVLARRSVIRHELVRVHAGTATPIARVPEVRFLDAVSPRGDRALVAREPGQGIVDLATGDYTYLADGVAPVFDGDRVVAYTKGDLIEIGLDGRHPIAHPNVAQWATLACAQVQGRCALRWWTRGKPWVARVDRLATPIETPTWVQAMAVSPDGVRVALVGEPPGIQVIDLETGHVDDRSVALPAPCDLVRQYVAWGAHDDLYVTALCHASNSHVFHLEPGKPPVDVFPSTAWLAGFGVLPDGDLIADAKVYSASLVLIEGL